MSARGHAPLVGITCEAVVRGEDGLRYDLLCDHRYSAAINQAGGHPVLLPIAHRKMTLKRYLQGIDGLVIVGGDDVDPSLYGEEPGELTHVILDKRTAFEVWLYREGIRRRLPIFGICYGMQLINVLEGGSLYQDIEHCGVSRLDAHSVEADQHKVRVIPETRLAGIIGRRSAIVSTDHHQAVREIAPGFEVSALADDGVVEAIEHPDRPELMAVQWHPERMLESKATRRLFKTFVRLCRRYRDARQRKLSRKTSN